MGEASFGKYRLIPELFTVARPTCSKVEMLVDDAPTIQKAETAAAGLELPSDTLFEECRRDLHAFNHWLTACLMPFLSIGPRRHTCST